MAEENETLEDLYQQSAEILRQLTQSENIRRKQEQFFEDVLNGVITTREEAIARYNTLLAEAHACGISLQRKPL